VQRAERRAHSEKDYRYAALFLRHALCPMRYAFLFVTRATPPNPADFKNSLKSMQAPEFAILLRM